jgi:hypothetical protein
VRKILLTGISGTGKSTALAELEKRGYEVVDRDEGGWSEWSDADDGYVWRARGGKRDRARVGQRSGMSPNAWLAGGDLQRPENGVESREHRLGWGAPESGIELDEPPLDDDWANRKGSETHREGAKV